MRGVGGREKTQWQKCERRADMINTPYDEGDYILDDLLDLIWVRVRQFLFGWLHLSREDRLAKLA